MAVMDDRWLDAQYSVLGSALISPEVVPKVLHETGENDYCSTCLTVYKAMRKLFLSGAAVDPVSVAGELGSNYRDFLRQLMEITPTAANVDHYIALCREQARTSQLRELGRQMAEEEDPQKLRQLLEEANGRTADRPRLRITGVGDALKSFMDRHTRDVRYLTWPVRELNDRIYAELGDLIIIGGYPSSGKSAWALQCAWHWAREYRVGFFSLETSSEKLFDRLMSSVAELSMDNIKRNTIDQAGWDKVCSMREDITARQLELIPAAGMSPADVRAVTMMQRYQIIFIDYLQLLQGSGENRTAQVTQISIALHNLAQSLGVTVVALSQLARQGKQEKNSAPDMSALRESGQIEQDADLIMMLSLANKDQPEGNRELRIRKNKEGTCPNILLAFDGKHQTFRKAQPEKSDMLRQMARKKVVPTPVLASEKLEQMTVLPNDFTVPF